MKNINFTDLAAADRAFAQMAHEQLRSTETLNAVERARLAATRAQVRELVSQPRHAMPVWGWAAAPAAIAVVAISVLRFTNAPGVDAVSAVPPADVLIELAADVNAPSSGALMWVSDEAGPDFYRDLEFYQWLQSRSPTEPNA